MTDRQLPCTARHVHSARRTARSTDDAPISRSHTRLGNAFCLVRDAHGLAQRRRVKLARLAAQRRLLAQRLLQPHHAARFAVHQHLTRNLTISKTCTVAMIDKRPFLMPPSNSKSLSKGSGRSSLVFVNWREQIQRYPQPRVDVMPRLSGSCTAHAVKRGASIPRAPAAAPL